MLWLVLSSMGSAPSSLAADATIRLGQTVSMGVNPLRRISRVQAAYFKMVNDSGGIHGLPVTLIPVDDRGDAREALEQTRALVNEHVLAIFASQGAGVAASVQSYLNAARVPQLFVGGRAAGLADPLRNPWTLAFDPSYVTEGAMYGTYLARQGGHPRIAILRSDDATGAEYLQGIRHALAGHANVSIISDGIIAADEGTDQCMQGLRSRGADILLIFTLPKRVAGLINCVQASGWRGTIFIPHDSVELVATQAIPADSTLLSSRYLIDPRDPTWGNYSRRRWQFQEFTRWQSQPGASRYVRDFVAKYLPDLDPMDPAVIYGYSVAEVMFKVLQACGRDLSRENLMIQAANLHGMDLPLGLPGVRVSTNPRNYTVITQGQLARFNGAHWTGFGEVLEGDDLGHEWPPPEH